MKKQYPQGLAVAAGGAIGDAIWAILAFFGISPFTRSLTMEAIFFLVTAAVTGVLGFIILKDSKFVARKEEVIVVRIRRKRWAFLKGLSLVLVNPLGIVTWMVVLQFLRKINVYIPLKLNYEILFFIIVALGAATYFTMIVFITNRMKSFFNPHRTKRITKYLGYGLLVLSAYFIFNAVKVFFFNSSSFNIQ